MNYSNSLRRRTVIMSASAFLLGGFLIGFVANVSTAWVSPTLPPPSGNVAGPITTGNDTQVKSGKIRTASTINTDPGNTLVTKDYVDAAAGTHVRGAAYGHCAVQLDKDFNIIWTDPSPVWPVIACPAVGAPPSPAAGTCAPGFSSKQFAYWQMNSSFSGDRPNGGTAASVESKLNHFLDADTYIVLYHCYKN